MNLTLSLFERIVWTSRAAEDSQQIHLNYLELKEVVMLKNVLMPAFPTPPQEPPCEAFKRFSISHVIENSSVVHYFNVLKTEKVFQSN